ncbi:hypothetical protein [Actinoplanes sp. N902-109]|uniref:hypothetical protein n=1 Tax=Actinoplanes sp. (strain N902-109) TaxID=649831 RepID=UPI00032954B1|nr:hypothetical protein [Actinoplanes sp. N902-109]AGL15080.1 hypothetical protein L083_1570 [Actinoplanes sp. N902-109]
MKIRRRLGKAPHERGSLNNATCPDIFELSDGRFAIIGTDVTDQLAGNGPQVGGAERIVVITRDTLLAARGDIPSV